MTLEFKTSTVGPNSSGLALVRKGSIRPSRYGEVIYGEETYGSEFYGERTYGEGYYGANLDDFLSSLEGVVVASTVAGAGLAVASVRGR